MNTPPPRYLADIARSPSFHLAYTPQLAEEDHGSCRWCRSYRGHQPVAVRVVKPARRDWVRPEHRYACAQCAAGVARGCWSECEQTVRVEWTEVSEP